MIFRNSLLIGFKRIMFTVYRNLQHFSRGLNYESPILRWPFFDAAISALPRKDEARSGAAFCGSAAPERAGRTLRQASSSKSFVVAQGVYPFPFSFSRLP